jgi:hypothetical protein
MSRSCRVEVGPNIGPNDWKRLQLITPPRVLEGPGWFKAPIGIPRVGVCVIATLRRHRRHGAVRTIGALVCRSRPIRIVVVAVVLSIASSDASSAPTTNPNAAIFFRILVMIGSFSCISSSVKPKQPHLQASAGVFEITPCANIHSPGYRRPFRSGPSKTWIKIKKTEKPAASRAIDGTL